MASECAGEQDGFWAYHDRIYEESRIEGSEVFTDQGLIDLAEEVGIDPDEFKFCMTDARPLDQLQADLDVAMAMGVNSTPTIFINDVQYLGSRSFEAMSAHIEGLLAGQ
jgi:predicted DsbA family dithiol-disulfide isomerase